ALRSSSSSADPALPRPISDSSSAGSATRSGSRGFRSGSASARRNGRGSLASGNPPDAGGNPPEADGVETLVRAPRRGGGPVTTLALAVPPAKAADRPVYRVAIVVAGSLPVAGLAQVEFH